jgi:peptide/nickel transport system permease protein
VRSLRPLAYRVARLIVVLLLVSFVSFMLLQLTPGDPAIAILGEGATPEAVDRVHEELGLDEPLLVRYADWLSNALHGDLGQSLVPPYGDVSTRIADALPVTVELAVLAELMALIVAVPVGVYAAYRENRTFDRITSTISFGLLSVPTFVTGLVLAMLFALQWQIFPRAQWVRLTSDEGVWSNLSHAFLPALALALVEMAVYTRVLRADMVGTLKQDYISAARAQGLPTHTILFGHALRQSSISLVTVSAVSLGRLLGGTVIVEVVFGLPGLGRLLVEAVGANDYPLVQGIVLVIATAYVLVNVLVDLSYLWIDPRTRVHGR